MADKGPSSITPAATANGKEFVHVVQPATCTITIASPGVVTAPAHGKAADSTVRFLTTGALPTGLTADTVYYVRNPTANTFEVSATAGGGSINTSGSQSGTHYVYGNSRRMLTGDIASVSHTHAEADVTGLTAALAAKLDDSQAGATGLAVLGAASEAAARAAIGAVIGTDVQAYDADLAAIAALTTTSYGRALLELADAAALTAALNAFTSTLKGAVPASGGGTSNFLRADGTWAAPAGGSGALAYLGTHNLSAVSGVDIEDFAGLSNKGKIILEFEDITFSVDGGGLSLLFKLNGTYQSGANSYKWSRRAMWSPTTASNTGSNADSSFPMIAAGAGAVGSAAGEGMSATVELLNPFDAVGWKRAFHKACWADDQAGNRFGYADGQVAYYGTDYANALGGVRVSPSSGTMSGKIHVYAVATA